MISYQETSSYNQDILLEISRLNKTIQDEREQRAMETAGKQSIK
jgi:hypothetical protein